MYDYIHKLKETLDLLDQEGIKKLADLIKKSDRVWILGNGGSLATASHFAEDLIKLANVPAIALNDPVLLSMNANDEGIENMFFHSLKTLAKTNDLVIGITMGGSANVLKAISNEELPGNSFLITKGTNISAFPNSIVIPTDDIQIAEDVCLSIAHMVCRLLKVIDFPTMGRIVADLLHAKIKKVLRDIPKKERE